MPERTTQIQNIQPLVRRDTALVVGWICRVHLSEGDQAIYEDLTLDVPQALRKPLHEWRQSEVRALVDGFVAQHPLVAHLHKGLDGRLLIEQRMDFTLASLPE